VSSFIQKEGPERTLRSGPPGFRVSGDPAEPLLKVRGVTKKYPGTVALNRVDLDLYPGEVHAVLGGNGAGKSTLAKVICGVERFEEGEITFEGRSLGGFGPREVSNLGIGIVHQNLNLFESLSVAENLAWLVGNVPTMAGLVRRKRSRAQAVEVLSVLGHRTITPDAKVAELRPAETWLVAIAAALYTRPKLLILDESTAALPQTDADEMFEFITEQRQQGLAVLMVTHRLDEVRRVADRITVLADGKVKGQLDESMGTRDLVSLMFGAEVAEKMQKRKRGAKADHEKPLVSIENVSTRKLRNLSLTINRGEIVGLAGALGSGRTEIVRLLTGDRDFEVGRIEFEGQDYRPRDARAAVKRGIAAVREDPIEEGVLHGLSLGRNITLTGLDAVKLGLSPLIRKSRESSLAKAYIDRLSIKGRHDQTIETLSGGNRQKALIARLLLLDLELLILDEPSQGIDMPTRLQIREVLHELADRGKAVLIVSSEFDDLVRDCTRIVVVREGEVVKFDAPFEEVELAHIAYGEGS
jgi:ABC-type sugar transport system ATPase subunit